MELSKDMQGEIKKNIRETKKNIQNRVKGEKTTEEMRAYWRKRSKKYKGTCRRDRKARERAEKELAKLRDKRYGMTQEFIDRVISYFWKRGMRLYKEDETGGEQLDKESVYRALKEATKDG